MGGNHSKELDDPQPNLEVAVGHFSLYPSQRRATHALLFRTSAQTFDQLGVGHRRKEKIPGKRILATKLDMKAAFQQCHLNALMAVQTCSQLPKICLALMMLRLSFGSTPCPLEWGAMSEPICDLIIAILQSNDWDPLNLFASVPPQGVTAGQHPLWDWMRTHC